MERRKLKTPKDHEEFDAFTKYLKVRLDRYPFLKWKTKKTVSLVKRLYKEGYVFEDILSSVIRNS